MKLVLAVAYSFATTLLLQSTVLSGRVVDASGDALPGARVVVSGRGSPASVVTDASGRFRIEGVPRGSQEVTVSLAGFRTRTVTFRVDGSASRDLMVALESRPLHEVLWVVPPPGEAYKKADIIVHLRIESTKPPGPCGKVVTSFHVARVLRVFKGDPDATIQLQQEVAGRCRDDDGWHEGIEEPYPVGAEYVALLVARSDGFGRLAGPALTFGVHGRQVMVGGFAGVKNNVSFTEFAELLERLSR